MTTAIELGFIVGAMPTICMIIVSLVLYQLEVSDHVEAAFQNFAAGLILAAVAAELFPLVQEAPDTDSYIGITIGFSLGYLFLVGMEPLSEYLVEGYDKMVMRLKRWLFKNDFVADDDDGNIPNPSSTTSQRRKTRPKSFDGEELPESTVLMTKNIIWDDEGISFASTAIEESSHKEHIKQHLLEISEEINVMQVKSVKMIDSELSEKESEAIAEEIDEQIHSLQYKVDHCRRLLQGSESTVSKGGSGSSRSSWLNEEKKLNMKKRMTALRYTSDHLLEHLNESYIDQFLIKEIYEHMAEMDVHIHQFHDCVDLMDKIWRKSRPLVEPEIGATLPVSLIIPVTLDCFVDGFMIGISLGLQPKAGFILAGANCLEMSFLGMAYSARIAKCTGSTPFHRLLAILGPPLLMFLASGLGAWLADITVAYPVIYIAFVSFGIIVLLSLVCCELLIEAKEAQGDDEKWYVSILVFVGVYVVLMFERVI